MKLSGKIAAALAVIASLLGLVIAFLRGRSGRIDKPIADAAARELIEGAKENAKLELEKATQAAKQRLADQEAKAVQNAQHQASDGGGLSGYVREHNRTGGGGR